MKENKKILFPVDLRDSNYKQVVEQGLQLVKGTQASVLFLQVVPFIYAYENSPAVLAPLEEVMVKMKVDSEKEMKGFLAEIQIPGLEISGEVEIGYPQEVILKVAERDKADMIMIGTHGRAGIAKFLLGSVADKVVRSSPIPVVTIRP